MNRVLLTFSVPLPSGQLPGPVPHAGRGPVGNLSGPRHALVLSAHLAEMEALE